MLLHGGNMRNFIISDLHGDGNVYDSIISYLENVSKDSDEEITLYINGDLIDRGYDSGRILIDVIDRIENKKLFNIEYLGGNHELMLWQDYLRKENGKWPSDTLWHDNGGGKTLSYFEDLLTIEEETKICEFIGDLKLYHKFKETLDGKNIVLVHAKCPSKVLDDCELKIRDNNKLVNKLVWTRDDDLDTDYPRIGNPDYFTIIGHTPLTYPKGYAYYSDENYMNIDGGCSGYVLGYDGYDHVPLVEIDDKNNRLIILTFNNNNEIISGHYFYNSRSTTIRNLDKYRKYIDNNVKIKKKIIDGNKVDFI